MNGQRLFGALTAGVALAVLAAAAWSTQTRPAFAGDSFFDVFANMNSTSSDPGAAPIQVQVSNAARDGKITPQERAQMSFAGTQVPVRLRMEAQAPGGGGVGGGSTDSFFDVFFDLTDPATPPPAGDSFFDVFVELTLEDGTPAPGRVTAVNDWAVDSFFDITYDIDFADGGRQTLHFTGTPSPSYDLFALKVSALVPSLSAPAAIAGGDSFFDIYTELKVVDPPPSAPPLDYSHAMTLKLTGVYTPVPEPSSIVLAAIGLVGLIGYARRNYGGKNS